MREESRPAIAVGAAALACLAGCLSNGAPNNLGTFSCNLPTDQTISLNLTSPCQVTIDFGDVPTGAQVSTGIQVQDPGAWAVTFKALSGNLDPAFTIDTSALQKPLPPGGNVTVTVVYAPTSPGTYSSAVTIPSNAAGGAAISLQLSGQSFTAGLSVSPSSLDFGEVLVGNSVNKTVTLTNTSSVDAAGITSIVNGDPGDYTISGCPATLAQGASAQIGLTYAPLGAGGTSPSSRATAVFSFANGTASVAMTGKPNSAALTVSPTTIDFGFVPLNTSPLGCTTVTSQAMVNLVVTGVADFTTAGGFAVAATDDAKPPNPIAFPFTIPPGAGARLCFTLNPKITQQYVGQVTLTNGDASGNNPVVRLTGWGGGPQISCSPMSLEFGDVVAGASATLPVTCTNTGTAIATTNLKLGQPSASPSPFSAQFDPGNPYSAAGIVAGQSVQIDVTYAAAVGSPTSGGLSIPNNGGQGSTVQIPLTVGQVFPEACEFAIAPPALDFGNPAQGSSPVDLAFEIQNQGTAPCLVANPRIQNDTSGSFEILSTSIAPDLDAGAIVIPAPGDGGTTDLLVQVRFSPQSKGIFSAKAAFSILDALQQSQSVSLSGTSQSTCLVVAPPNLDFGTVALGDAGVCGSSAELDFTVFNQCPGSATLSALGVQLGPGDAVRQFSAPEGSSVPLQLYGGSQNAVNQVSFALSFEPTSPGFHSGGILVSDGTVSTLVSLSGTALSGPTQTDNFVAALPKADVLFVLDTIGFSPSLLQLDGGIAAFVQDGAQIDYRFAVTTDNDDALLGHAEFGRLLPCPNCSVSGTSPEVIDRTTIPDGGSSANPATALVNLLASVPAGGQPSSDRDFFQSLLLAIELAPLPGVDFYRPGAYFAAVTVTSSSGDDTSRLNWYENFFEAQFVSPSLFSWSYAGEGTSNGSGLLAAGDQPALVSKMIAGTGGVAVNADDPSWPGALAAIWSNATLAGSHYTLSGVPLNGQTGIIVTRNGSTVPQSGGGGPNWSYDSFINAILFNPLVDPPETGDQIAISYPVGCQ